MSVDPSLDSMHVSLTITCKKLPNRDTFSKSDPYAQLLGLDLTDKKWKVVGKTETIKNTQDPKFTNEFIIPYKFEEEQSFLIRIWDDDFGKSADDFLGETAQFKLGTLMGSRGQTLALPLQETNGHPVTSGGNVIVRAEEAGESADNISFTLMGKKFDSKDGFFGKSDPFFTISASSNGGMDYVEVYRSEYVKQNLNPTWKTATIPMRRLKGKVLKLEVTDWDADGTHDLIGIARVTLDDLISRRQNIELVHPPTKPKYQKSSYKNSGTVDVLNCFVQKSHSMIDYLRGGLQINLMVAIDFTGSNGDPRQPGTNHYGAGQYPNNYIQAIQSVGSIVIEYDSDKLIPSFGFGAKDYPSTPVSHCFPLTGNPATESVYGIPGVLSAYASCFQRGVILSGPTYFSQIIRRCAAIAGSNRNTYSILLLITDGEVNDVQETIDSICEAALAPLSIIIVGVGNASFVNMNVLDADVQPLVSSNGSRCQRDIVQFVPFNQVVRSGDPSLLAKETLKELPQQLVEYYKLKGVAPAAPIVVSDVEIATGPITASGPPPSAPGYAAVSVVAPPVPPSNAAIGQIGRDIFAQVVSL